MSKFYKTLVWLVLFLTIINLGLNSQRLNLFMWGKVAKVLKQHHQRMGAMDRRIDARIRTERNTKKLFRELGKELKIDGEL